VRKLALILLWLVAPLAATAQPGAPIVDARQLPPGILDLTRSWRVHDGDNPAWCTPNLDDRNWPVEALDSSAASEPGWRWFRLTVRLPQDPAPPLSLLLDGREGAYELYIDGNRIPGAALKPSLLITDPRDRVFPLPGHADVGHLALRVHLARRLFERAPAFRVALLGPTPAIAARQIADANARLTEYLPNLAIQLALILAGIGALGLYFAQKRRGEYLWLGLYLAWLGGGATVFSLYYGSFAPVSANYFVAIPVNYSATLALVEFLFRFAGRRVTWPWRAYQCLLLAVGFICPWLVWFGVLGYGPYDVIEALVLAPSSLLFTVLLFRWYVAGNREAGWLILPTLFPTTTLALWDTGVVMQYFGLSVADRFLRPVTIGPLVFHAFDLADGFFLLAIGVVMFFRFSRVSLEQARAASELEAAQRVQTLLLRSQQSANARLRIESVYRPAQEVGGDFFHTVQIGALTRMVVGDVSGKGMGAAMLVSVLLGALDAIHDTSPAAVLQHLNGIMLARQQGGFATCFCALAGPDGVLTLANAGHLAPYRNGEEVQLDNGLPLGIAPETTYAESTLDLTPGDQLTFLSDGVVEAQNPQGELFGFDRTRQISTQSAEAIARAAQNFGQQDDITVLSLQFAGAESVNA
jgi:Stage II sporulation protein E (SpoIIE)